MPSCGSTPPNAPPTDSEGVEKMANVLRIVDANANRAREALRVMEEAARFLLDDQDLAASIKQLRHDLATTLGGIRGLEASRDTPGDVGTQITTATESRRASIADVAVAAGKRLSEALRAIEEYAKTLGESANIADEVQQLRYRGYDLEQRLHRRLATGRRRQWRLCLLLTESLCTHHTWQQVLDAAIAGGADCVQLREKHLDAGPLLDRARMIVQRCHRDGVSVIVNDRPDVALLSGADGVHLGQADLPAPEARKLVGGQLLIGVSTCSLDQARRACNDGADYCGVGPMFDTTTKHKDTIVGPTYLRQYLAWDKLAHLAIGGITPDNIDQLARTGCRGVAVSAAICSAVDPAAAAAALLAALRS